MIDRSSAVRRLVGCYDLFDRTGRPAAASLYWAPATARLDDGGRAIRLTPVVDSGNAPGTPGAYTWSVDSLVDTVRVQFSSGFSGTEFVLGFRERGDTLGGRAVEHWDFGPPFETAAGRAYAVRRSCAVPS